MAIVYSGGTYVNTTFLGDTKADIITAIQTQLTAAGWTVVSGGGTTNLLMQTAQDPTTLNQGRVRFRDNGGNCVQVTIENVSGSVVQGASVNIGGQLLPSATTTYRIIASKYQFFCFVPGTTLSRQFVCAGIYWIPTFLQGIITEGIYMGSNAQTDTSPTVLGSFRTVLNFYTSSNGPQSNQASIVNGNIFQFNALTATVTSFGSITLALPTNSAFVQANAYRWHDLSLQISEPLIAVGLQNNTDEALIRGQLYDCCVISDSFPTDTTTSFLDQGATHAFWGITSSNASSTFSQKGTLFVATS